MVSELVRDKIQRQRRRHVAWLECLCREGQERAGISASRVPQQRTQHVTAYFHHASNVQVPIYHALCVRQHPSIKLRPSRRNSLLEREKQTGNRKKAKRHAYDM